MAVKLTCNTEQLDALHEKANGRGEKATVDRAALFALLVDRNKLAALYRGDEVEEAD